MSMLDSTAQNQAEVPVLQVRDLCVEFESHGGNVKAVNGVDFDVLPGKTLGIVGESGSGKSVTAMSLLGLVPTPPARLTRGWTDFGGRDLLRMRRRELARLRGKKIAMIFQDPMTSLTPVLTVGFQLAETLRIHDQLLSRTEARTQAINLLELVGVPDAAARAKQFPHEFSGGMRQRAMIAMAMANKPDLLIADEPTTALDVTIQAQVIDVLRTAQRETGAAMIVITHDLGVIAEVADHVAVMYGGRVVESGSADDIFYRPRHPYTVGLIGSLARLDVDLKRLVPIPGQPPNMKNPPTGCAFHPRCALARGRDDCRMNRPQLVSVGEGHLSACHFSSEVDEEHRRVMDELGVTEADS